MNTNVSRRLSSELKGLARETLLGHYSTVISAFFLIQASLSLISFTYANFFALSGRGSLLYNIGMLIITLLAFLGEAGFSSLLLNLARGNQIRIGDVFLPFTRCSDKILITSLVKILLVVFCFIPGLAALLASAVYFHILWLRLLAAGLLILGGIFSMYLLLLFSMTVYLCLDESSLSAVELLHASRELMKGNCFRLFYLCASFFGVALLGVFSLGIGLLWIVPYMEMTIITFYRELRNEL